MNQPGARPPAQKSGGSTALKFFAFGCLAMLLIGGAAMYYLYVKAAQFGREMSAYVVEESPAQMMKEMGMPEAEIDTAMVPLKAFAKDIRDEKVSLERGVKVVEALFDGPAFTSLMMRGFELKYLEPSDLSDEEKKAAHIDITRFNQGVSTGKISKKKTEELGQIVTISTRDPQGRQRKELKETITPEEMQQCLKLMKDAADQAEIENKEFPIDLAGEIDKAIKKGMAAVQTIESKDAGAASGEGEKSE